MSHDEERGLLNGERKRSSSVFTTPNAVIFAVALVSCAFIGASVVTGSKSSLGAVADVRKNVEELALVDKEFVTPHHHNAEDVVADETTDLGDDGTDEELMQKAIVTMVEGTLKTFLKPFTNTSTSKLLERAKGSIKAVIDAKDDVRADLKPVLDSIDLSAHEDLAAAVKAMEATANPEWVNDADVKPNYAEITDPISPTERRRGRRLHGGVHGVSGGGKTIFEYADEFSGALNITKEEMNELFPKIGTYGAVIAEGLVAKGDACTSQEKLVLAVMDLSVVSARAAPVPFGKGADAVFETSWAAVLKVLANVDPTHLSDIMSDSMSDNMSDIVSDNMSGIVSDDV